VIVRQHAAAAWAAAMIALASALSACGPGVGGTGTGYGETPGLAGLAWFSAEPRSACEGPQAALLSCSAPGPGLTAAPGPPVTLAGTCAAATLDGDQIVLDLICAGGVFAGRWGMGGDGVGRYYGLYGGDPLLPPDQPATLEVAVEGMVLSVWLRDGAGALLAGPLTLAPPGSGSGWLSE
jgi:hypothetical protein